VTQSNPVNWIYTYVMLSGWGGVSWFVYEDLQSKSNLTIGSSVFLGWWLWLMFRAMATQDRRNARREKIFNSNLNIDDYCTTCYELNKDHTGVFHVTCNDGLAESIIGIFGVALWAGLLGKLLH